MGGDCTSTLVIITPECLVGFFIMATVQLNAELADEGTAYAPTR